jgi:hypothetical protein
MNTIAEIVYQPTANQAYTKSSGGNADVDASNLSITFTVPASGVVWVEMEALCDAAVADYGIWGLRQGATDVPGSYEAVYASNHTARRRYRHRFTGLTPDAELTWKWAWRSGSSITQHIYVGPASNTATYWGAAWMTVETGAADETEPPIGAPTVEPVPGFPLLSDLNWTAYEFISQPDGQIFHPAVIDGNALRVDDSQWTIDTPETPDSVLPFLTYLEWTGLPLLDMSFVDHIRIRMGGDGLNLYGGHATFWIVSGGTRWHLEEEMAVTDTMTTYDLALAGSWRLSYPLNEPAATLVYTKDHVRSYGIAFVGFSQEPTGALLVEEMTWWMNP